MRHLRQGLRVDRQEMEGGLMWAKGISDLLQEVTIIQPLHDLLHGSGPVRKDALDYLMQRGVYSHSPFPPPEWMTEALETMTPDELDRLRKCRTKPEAYRMLCDHRHRRLYGAPSRRSGRTVPADIQKERLRLAPGMTAREFAEHFNVCLAYAYAWSEKHGNILRKAPPETRGRKAPDEDERMRLAPGMTPLEFSRHFGITIQAAYAWNEKHGFPLRKKEYLRRKPL